MTTWANVSKDASAIAHTGWGINLPVGRYEVVDLDGVDESLAYVKGPDGGKLVCVGRHDPDINFVEEG